MTRRNPRRQQIRLRDATNAKLERICRRKRWKLVEAVDAAVDALIERDPELVHLRGENHALAVG
jgi:hypothetical protein